MDLALEHEVDDLSFNDAYDANGVDLTLIDWLLALEPGKRLDVLQDAINFFAPFQYDDADADS